MDHEVATKTHAVERYLLGEMPGTERDAFEEHYFACAECAAEIRSSTEFMRDMKAALRDSGSPRKASPPGWFSWFRAPVLVPTFAALGLAVVVGYQNLGVLPDLEAPRSMASAVILDGRTRGDVPQVTAGGPLRFATAVEGAAAARLHVQILGPSGSAVRGGEVASPASGGALDVYFPGRLPSGKYELIVHDGKGGRELARSSFEVVN